MRTSRTTVAVVCLLAGSLLLPSLVEAAFVTCTDARNYGENSGRLYTAQVYSAISCDPSRLANANTALTRALSRQVLRTSDSDVEKLCFYEGLYAGSLQQLAEEYAACGATGPFECIDRTLIARYAGAELVALSHAVRDPDAVITEGVAYSLFSLDGLFESGVGPCPVEPSDFGRCFAAIRDVVGIDFFTAHENVVRTTAEVVCTDSFL